MTTSVHGPGSRGSRQRTSRLLLLTVLTALVAGTCGSPTRTPSPSSTATTQASTSPSTQPTPAPGATDTPTPTAPPPDGAWGHLKLPVLKPVASLTPTKKGQAGAAIDTAFRFTSLDGSSAAKLATRLDVTPAIQLARTTTSGRTVTLTPAKPLKPGTTYRFALRRADGTIAGTWAVTAAKTLRIVGTTPESESTGVPRNTGIEFTFDQPGVTVGAIRDAFSISPATKGRFEVHGKVAAFVPTKRLKAYTLYTVTLHQGVPLPGTGQKLERDVVDPLRDEGRRRQPCSPGHPLRDGRFRRSISPRRSPSTSATTPSSGQPSPRPCR